MLVKQGAEVKAGEPLFYNKANEQMLFVSPVSGELVEIVRGARRRILTLKILADKTQEYTSHNTMDVAKADADEVRKFFFIQVLGPSSNKGLMTSLQTPDATPKAIFISGYATAPLAADPDFVLQGKEAELQAAITALGKLTPGKIHVSVGKSSQSPLAGLEGVTVHKVSGPHPAGLVGTQINKIDPINKGEVAWTINPQDLVVIGELLLTGKFNAERTIALPDPL